MLIVPHAAVAEILDAGEREIVELVREAYRWHEAGRTVVPHSVFLRFPDDPRSRIIGLPAYLGGDEPAAGIKWISSFPGNISAGLARASAAIVLNSMANGHPIALIEGSLISAKRTAASAALAADLIIGDEPVTGVTLIGTGVINFEVLRFLAAVFPGLRTVTVYDSDPDRAAAFAARARALRPDQAVDIAGAPGPALAAHRLISIATTAAEPHTGLDDAPPGSLVLHVSLRDLYPGTIRESINVVDDADHVCREQTSVHLAEQIAGDRDFIHATIGQLVQGVVELPAKPDDRIVVSPFGLGVLDLALAAHVHTRARQRGLGLTVDDFLPAG
jgi:2,3-diaminopropionate biosynthesis protein SbnB